MAILDALDIAIQNNNVNKINILTDSLSVLEALRHPKLNSKVNVIILKIKDKIDEFTEKNKKSNTIQFIWIPSHIVI